MLFIIVEYFDSGIENDLTVGIKIYYIAITL